MEIRPINKSHLIDLRKPWSTWCYPSRSIPDSIVTPSGERLEGRSLPNASLCADFLVTPTNIWAGVTVGIVNADIPSIIELFQLARTPAIKILTAEAASRIERYSKYEGWGWLEVCWCHSETYDLIEVQTNGVLWYQTADECPSRVVVLGLEDVEGLKSEADRPLSLPQKFCERQVNGVEAEG